MGVKRITWRWLLNSFGVIVAIILIIEVIFAIAITRYHYDAVRQRIKARADVVTTAFTQYAGEGNAAYLYNSVRDYVSGFSARDKMELMAIDDKGQPLFTSSGFEPDYWDELTDYALALASDEHSGEVIRTLDGERVMSSCFLLQPADEANPVLSAVRFMVSLENVDRQIAFWIAGMVLLGAAVLLMVLFSSSYFISSIVNPIGEVSETARRIADGDFGAHLEKRYDDEIGDLCDTINYMAERLDETERLKNDFISSVSHELRTPLTAIQGWGETLRADHGADREMLEKGMNVIISETARLSQMVEELLDFSRMQSGRMSFNMERVDVLAELSDVVLMYGERARHDGITLTYSDSDLIVPIIGDKNRLRQVFVNIIDNAVKYSDRGGSVDVRVRLVPKALVITVEDKGIGIRAEDLPRVKTRFFKTNTTRRSSGIGLAVADEIIARHKGTLDISSVYDKGTCVTITLPTEKAWSEEPGA